MKKVYLTKDRLEELRKELNDLIGRRREEVAERLKRAKELGDLSENSEYFEAREEQGRVESRIIELQDIVKNAEIIKRTLSDTVKIGATVTLNKNGETVKYTIVGPNEARPENGLISNESPLGRAFLNKKVGETVVAETPKGKSEYRVIAID